MIVLYVPEPSPSLNQFSFSHWRRQHSMKKKWALWLMAEVKRTGAALATGKRRLTIERHGKRRLDIDNIIGGAKGCITDNLRALGMLVDDHDDAIEFVAKNVQLPKGAAPHTIIYLEDI
jgi:hypothetical protein